jgi:ABC-type lipoprotein export system ATPase subunit
VVTAIVRAEAVHKSYRRQAEVVRALRGVDLDVHAGQVVAIRGASGSGKTTLLALLCGWETPDSGRVIHSAGLDWAGLALIPQTLGLLEDLTIGENVMLPARLNRVETADDHGDSLIRRLGISGFIDRHPDQTSLGEQQRTAVARALLLRPALVLADEPTAHQDHGWADVVLGVLREHAAAGTAVVLVSHHAQAWEAADVVLTMTDGRLQ